MMMKIKLTPKQKKVMMAANKNGKLPKKVTQDSPKVVENLKEKGLVKQKKAANGKKETTLTKKGEQAVKATQTPKAEKPEKAKKPAVRKDTKQYKILQMLARKSGATIKQLAEATGWKETTLRGTPGALKIKLGVEIESEKREGKDTVYRITGGLDGLL
ncbi:DUF3489 domain-containing protein [Endozoicomonas sp. Mp262]|uniref:DUF3489 domain-containing protein n=1 Tax=Endozoicomonas sp. Mp262 TaxID=2919499 RepID=UPI0021DA669D